MLTSLVFFVFVCHIVETLGGVRVDAALKCVASFSSPPPCLLNLICTVDRRTRTWMRGVGVRFSGGLQCVCVFARACVVVRFC